ncbi:MAG: adenylyltransferase/cytidyltransferase family protein [Opitutales bacterium]|nr:adenylyltransferase/cytidyltransferase family protein [Opitutales bacterium]
MIKVFVSGCYDILHAGHLEFFRQARALGDHLTVCFASSGVLWEHKQRRSSLPDEHKRALLEALDMVDDVVIGEGMDLGLDFLDHFFRVHPQILAVTDDDQYENQKRAICDQIGCKYMKLPKLPPSFEPVSTSQIVRWIKAPLEAPLRVDFAGGWLDVPRYARSGGYIVNCSISPTVSLKQWDYHLNSGLGGSGAWALLNGKSGVEDELALGVGWQDPAVISETGLCVWRSGPRPVLDFKLNGDWLAGKLALLWTGKPHDTPGVVDQERDYDRIELSGKIAREGLLNRDLREFAEGIRVYHEMQLAEGMDVLPDAAGALAHKYCGGGWGGYAVYLFEDMTARDAWVAIDTAQRRVIEPLTRP